MISPVELYGFAGEGSAVTKAKNCLVIYSGKWEHVCCSILQGFVFHADQFLSFELYRCWWTTLCKKKGCKRHMLLLPPRNSANRFRWELATWREWRARVGWKSRHKKAGNWNLQSDILPMKPRSLINSWSWKVLFCCQKQFILLFLFLLFISMSLHRKTRRLDSTDRTLWISCQKAYTILCNQEWASNFLTTVKAWPTMSTYDNHFNDVCRVLKVQRRNLIKTDPFALYCNSLEESRNLSGAKFKKWS